MDGCILSQPDKEKGRIVMVVLYNDCDKFLSSYLAVTFQNWQYVFFFMNGFLIVIVPIKVCYIIHDSDCSIVLGKIQIRLLETDDYFSFEVLHLISRN